MGSAEKYAAGTAIQKLPGKQEVRVVRKAPCASFTPLIFVFKLSFSNTISL